MAVTTGDKILLSDYTDARTKAETALTTTGTTFTWQYAPTVGVKILTEPVDEIKDAFDVAYDAMAAGNATYNTSVQSSRYSYYSGHDGSNKSHNSDNNTYYSGNKSSYKT